MKFLRRDFLAGVAATGAFPGIAQAFLLHGGQNNGVTPPPPPGSLTTMTLVNTSGSTQSANFITPVFGMTFKKGDITSGTAPIFTGTVSTTVYPYSWGLQSYYSDGSLRHASFMFLCKDSVPGSSNLSVTIKSGGTAPSASSRTLTEVYAQSIQIGGAGIGSFGGLSGTWNAYLTNDGNNTEQYVYLDGQAGKVWRIKTHFAQTSGGTAHGQLECYHYVTALQDNSGNLGGFRYIARITQPYYNNDTPTKALRAFSSISWQHGSGPTVVPLTWPFSNQTLTSTNGNQNFSCSGHNFYSGAQAGPSTNFVNCVPGYLSATTDSALSTSQIYFAYTTGLATNTTQLNLSENPNGSFLTPSGGTSTFVPLPTCLHFGSIWTADTQGRSNFFQGTGSMSSDNTVRTQYNQTYLHSTGAIPPWNLSVSGTTFGGTIKDIPSIVASSSTSYWTGTPAWNPVSCGPLSPNWRGGPGTDVDIGPQTVWHCHHFYNQSSVGDLVVRSVAFASDFDGVGSFRDVSTGNYINVSNTSYTGMPAPSSNQQIQVYAAGGNTNGFTGPSTPPSGETDFLWGGEQKTDHKPCMAYYAFLVFGEPHFHDLMVEAATGAEIEFFGPNRTPTSPAGYGIVLNYDGGGLRANVWRLRDIMLGATFMAHTPPDGSQIAQYLSDLATTNTAYANDIFSSTYLGSFLNSENAWLVTSGTSFLDPSGSGYFRSYAGCVFSWFAALGDSSSMTWVNDVATWDNYILSNFGGYHNYAEYSGMVVLDSSGNYHAGISSGTLYGIPLQAVVGTSLTWTRTSPCFSVDSTQFGYTVTAGDRYVFQADQTAGPPGGLSNLTPYYVVNVSGNTFDLSATLGGSVIIPTNTGTIPVIDPAGDLGLSSPYIVLASAPVASTGNIPTSTKGLPDGYLPYKKTSWDWAIAAGASGYSSLLTDASTRLNADFPDFTSDANWYTQSSF